MNTILVDDDEISRQLFSNMISYHKEVDLIGSYSSADEVVSLIKENKPEIDLAILDICMPGMNGVELAEFLRKEYPNILILFETSYEEYAMDAFRLKAAGYIMKPYSKQEVTYAIESAYLLSKRGESKIYARTFGHFDLFVDGKVVLFKSAKAKELLALLIDRQGGAVTSDQVIATLWEDRPNDEATQNLACKIGKTLKKELEAVGAGELLRLERGVKSIDLSRLECDLYDYLEGKNSAVRQYYGEYMSDYEWGETRIYSLNRQLEGR